MTDDRHEEQDGRGSWERLPQGDYDDGATAFVQLPEGGVDALLASDSPLAAPGHGYVPPTFTPGDAGADPAAGGTWGTPAEGARWPEPSAAQGEEGGDRFTYNPGSTGQWAFPEAAGAQQATAAGQDVTGEWSIPVAGGDLPDESGEFSTSSLVEQWGGTPPPTLPGGAPAPWVTGTVGQPWPERAGEAPTEQAGQAPAQAPGEPSGGAYGHTRAADAAGAPQAAQEPVGPGAERD
ncbi:(2Fe-2S)-binding protein, partial [Streptomyces caeni]